jgi:DNA polymerase III alpha subunit
MGVVPIEHISRYIGRRIKLAGILVTTRRVRTVRGEHMRFLTLEDMTGTVETVLFPEAYRRWGSAICSLGPYLLSGTVDDDYGHPTINVHTLKPLTNGA